MKCLRFDGIKKYFSTQFISSLQKEGIQKEISSRYTPRQNNVAERMNQTIVEAARAMLEEKHMPEGLLGRRGQDGHVSSKLDIGKCRTSNST